MAVVPRASAIGFPNACNSFSKHGSFWGHIGVDVSCTFKHLRHGAMESENSFATLRICNMFVGPGKTKLIPCRLGKTKQARLASWNAFPPILLSHHLLCMAAISKILVPFSDHTNHFSKRRGIYRANETFQSAPLQSFWLGQKFHVENARLTSKAQSHAPQADTFFARCAALHCYWLEYFFHSTMLDVMASLLITSPAPWAAALRRPDSGHFASSGSKVLQLDGDMQPVREHWCCLTTLHTAQPPYACVQQKIGKCTIKRFKSCAS